MNSNTKVNWSGPVINVIGVGATDYLQLCKASITAINESEIIIAAEHQLKRLPETLNIENAQVVDFPKPLSILSHLLNELDGKAIAILASGDPLFFGIGAWLNRHVGVEHCRYFTNISSVQAAFSLLGKSWQEAKIVSLHGRPLVTIRRYLQANKTFCFLTDSTNTPVAIANELLNATMGDSDVWVIESLGTADQKISHFIAQKLAENKFTFSPLNVCVVETKANKGYLPEFPGIADSVYADIDVTENNASRMFSKREVRLTILSLLAPCFGEIGWDVGAGHGSVSIEWARWKTGSKVFAIECDEKRIKVLAANREKYGVVDNLEIVQGDAPDVLSQMPDPHAVFIGGSNGKLEEIIDVCWARLAKHGRLVVSIVTDKNRAKLLDHTKKYVEVASIEWTEIAVSKGMGWSNELVLRPQLPVLLLQMIKLT